MSEEGSKSFFNAGMAMAERIDGLQRAINAARFNPLALNGELQKYNYEIMCSSCDGLLKECWGKLTPTEKTEARKIKEATEGFLQYFPVIMKRKDDIKINYENYRNARCEKKTYYHKQECSRS